MYPGELGAPSILLSSSEFSSLPKYIPEFGLNSDDDFPRSEAGLVLI